MADSVDDGDAVPELVGLDKGEFDEAFRVFSNDKDEMSTATSTLIPFLKSLGLRDRLLDAIVHDIKDVSTSLGTMSVDQLRSIVTRRVHALAEPWPSDRDVLEAFKVFDGEGVGFIKVTLLKRFLVQAQLDVDDSILERLIRDNCQIDGDDLINYEDFVRNVMGKYFEATSAGHS